ncbi:prolyl oligopeptidase family protein [Streptomyces sp. NPDC060031]|uniref:prolyl oligopeptidase family serine peptidase n=1 Tax=Streptomyces sp. NPDC060031 TaxID=3347043 RepID=UPI0036B2E70D
MVRAESHRQHNRGVTDDPFLWLEDIDGADALAWVAERNAETRAALTAEPGFLALQSALREVLDDTGRISYTTRRGEFLYSFWRDAGHPKGIWRRTTLDQYRTDDPEWELLLDVDALAADEGESWVWAGASVRYPDYRRALVRLSRDGSDAVCVREFDLAAQAFVADGFRVPEAKTGISWIDDDHVFLATDFGPGTLTGSGYPRTVRRWRRGTAPERAELVFEAAAGDVSAFGWHDATPGFERSFVGRRPTFFTSELFLLPDAGAGAGADGRAEPVKVDVPADADADVWRQWLLVTLRTPWLGQPAGSLLAFDFDGFLAGEREPQVLFAPDEHTALAGFSPTRRHLILNTFADVSTRMEVLTPGPQGWTRAPLADVPRLACATVTDTDPDVSDEYFLDVDSYLRPSTLYRGEIGAGTETLKSAPAHFDTTGLLVRQHFATSPDGTRVPYFVVGPDPDATPHTEAVPGPTLLYGYGGFELSMVPAYSGVTGRAWLARGGTYVVANIRGGGEYGPRWHQAALGADRVLAFEDFAAVAADLTARGITTPGRLGIAGGSNGGLLMGAMLTRYPELFGAIVAQVPLLDMLRFHRLLAGASWTAEYGDPDNEADRPHLAAYSPYHNLAAGQMYPPVLLMTSTRDDRVHPGHARKTAARLRELGHAVLFHEHTGGGHAGATDNEQSAFNRALTHTFLWRHLGEQTA